MGTMYIDSEEGVGFMKENFILLAFSLWNPNKINFAKNRQDEVVVFSLSRIGYRIPGRQKQDSGPAGI